MEKEIEIVPEMLVNRRTFVEAVYPEELGKSLYYIKMHPTDFCCLHSLARPDEVRADNEQHAGVHGIQFFISHRYSRGKISVGYKPIPWWYKLYFHLMGKLG